jgi:hypothetical protein
MPRDEVLAILGPPKYGIISERMLDYDDPSIMGWYAITFGADGNVSSIDDEY